MCEGMSDCICCVWEWCWCWATLVMVSWTRLLCARLFSPVPFLWLFACALRCKSSLSILLEACWNGPSCSRNALSASWCFVCTPQAVRHGLLMAYNCVASHVSCLMLLIGQRGP